MGNADKTKYPNIFSGAYWTNNGAGDDPEIIANRNNFVEEFDIVSAQDHKLRGRRFENEVAPPAVVSSMSLKFDHFEFYKRRDNLGYIAIISPYHEIKKDTPEFEKIINELGYKKYHSNLYNTMVVREDGLFTCPTYYLEVPYLKPR